MEKYTDYVFGLRFKEFPTICLLSLHSDDLTGMIKRNAVHRSSSIPGPGDF